MNRYKQLVDCVSEVHTGLVCRLEDLGVNLTAYKYPIRICAPVPGTENLTMKVYTKVEDFANPKEIATAFTGEIVNRRESNSLATFGDILSAYKKMSHVCANDGLVVTGIALDEEEYKASTFISVVFAWLDGAPKCQ